jgi:uncharacterized protein YndB with AHSA1/START domain
MTMSVDTQPLTRPPVAKAEMLIRKPIGEVFEAIVDPAITSKFWFSKGSGRLEAGRKVQWDWEMYNASAQVTVLEVVPNERVRVEWSGYGAPTTIEWRFTPRPDGTTYLRVTNAGFQGTADEIVAQALGSTEGFAFMLAGLKALLEHNILLNLVPDKFPDGLPHE